MVCMICTLHIWVRITPTSPMALCITYKHKTTYSFCSGYKWAGVSCLLADLPSHSTTMLECCVFIYSVHVIYIGTIMHFIYANIRGIFKCFLNHYYVQIIHMHESNLLWNYPMKLWGLPSPNLKTCFSFALRCPGSFEVDVEIGLLD